MAAWVERIRPASGGFLALNDRGGNDKERIMNGLGCQIEARQRFLRMLLANPAFTGSHFLRSSLMNVPATRASAEGKAFGFLTSCSKATLSSPLRTKPSMLWILRPLPARHCPLLTSAI